MSESNIHHVKHPAINLPRKTPRDQRLFRAIQARRHLCPPRGGGRAWINGRQVGGSNDRFAHLDVSYD